MSIHHFDIEGKVAIVTGAGRGLGRAIALGLAEAGANVVVAGRTQADLDRVFSEIQDRGHRAHAKRFDARQREESEALMIDIASEFGSLDILVLSHAIGDGGASEEVEEQRWREIIDIDLTSVFQCAQSAGRIMLKQGEGSIIFISSTSALVAEPGGVAYAAAKAGVDHMCRSLAAEWASRGIRLNCISPGFMTSHMRGTEEFFEDENLVKAVTDRTPMMRRGDPEELVGSVIFLASKASSFITGHVIPVDGGVSLL
ncbi:MAG: SDR family oxidoreductase [Pseudomonadota bacterium]